MIIIPNSNLITKSSILLKPKTASFLYFLSFDKRFSIILSQKNTSYFSCIKSCNIKFLHTSRTPLMKPKSRTKIILHYTKSLQSYKPINNLKNNLFNIFAWLISIHLAEKMCMLFFSLSTWSNVMLIISICTWLNDDFLSLRISNCEKT